MKMLVKSLLCVTVAMIMASVQADYLYWLVDESIAGADFCYAKIKWSNGTSGGYLVNANDGAADGATIFEPDVTWGNQWAQIGSHMLNSDYKFVVELYSDANCNSLFAVLDEVYGNGFGDTTASGQFGIWDPYVFTGSSSIPEPSGGALTLLGLGLFALRRKRKIA